MLNQRRKWPQLLDDAKVLVSDKLLDFLSTFDKITSELKRLLPTFLITNERVNE